MAWRKAAERLHERVLDAAPDSLAREVAQLHRLACEDAATPTCLGCDQDLPGGPGAVWPCRTCTLVARSMLRVADVEATLTRLRAEEC
jgi:hypothetical protein